MAWMIWCTDPDLEEHKGGDHLEVCMGGVLIIFLLYGPV